MPEPAVLQIDPLDYRLHMASRRNYPKPDDCSSPCWRNGGDHPCTCDDFDKDGTTEGGW